MGCVCARWVRTLADSAHVRFARSVRLRLSFPGSVWILQLHYVTMTAIEELSEMMARFTVRLDSLEFLVERTNGRNDDDLRAMRVAMANMQQ